jgi:hypothetical protein
MTPAYLRAHILPAAYAVLPIGMDAPAATAMLLAIALQESKCCHRRQVGGPARSFWQFEIGGVRGVLGHKASKPHLANALEALVYPVTDDATALYLALEHNDILAAVCARLLLWTLPSRLPSKDDPEAGWQQYLAAWRPGKPHRDTWNACYAQGWAA